MESLLRVIEAHGPWAAFAGILFIAYYRLVDVVIKVVHQNTEANTKNAKAVEQASQVMVEVKDAMHKCTR